MIDGPFFAAVRLMELDCRYSSILEADGPGLAVEDSPTVVSVSGPRSSVFLRFFFLDGLSSGASSRFLRFSLRLGSPEAETSDNTSLT